MSCTNDSDPAELEGFLTLDGDKRLHVRALGGSADAQAVKNFYARLSPRSRYLRFLSPMPSLPDSVLKVLTSVDHCRRVALVAEDENESGELIALGSYAAVDDERCEVALVVRDDWQRQQVGTALALRVLDAAEARGYRRFVVHVSSDNTAIRRLLRRVGDVVSAHATSGVSEIEFVSRARAH